MGGGQKGAVPASSPVRETTITFWMLRRGARIFAAQAGVGGSWGE